MYIIIYILILGGYVSTNQTTSYVGEMLSSMQVLLLKEVSTYLTTNNSHEYFSSELTFRQCTTDIPIKPINRPINRYRPINRIGKSEKLQYRIGIGSADY